MKPIGWLVKNAALDLWEAKREMALRAARWAGWVAGAVGLGLACLALWGVAEFPNPTLAARGGLSYAKVARCESALAGVPEDLRMSWLGPGSADVALGCRREGAEEFVERWVSAKWNGEERREALASLLRLRGAESALAMRWQPARASWSGRGFAEALGVAEPTEASRGWLGSSEAGEWGAARVAVRAALGFASALGLVIWAGQWIGELAWAPLMTLGLLAWCGWAGWILEGRARAAREGVRSGVRSTGKWVAAGAATMALAGAPAMGFVAMAMDFKMGDSGEATRSAPLSDCEARRSSAREIPSFWLGCREENGAMSLVAVASQKWSDEEASSLASKALGVRVALGSARMSSEPGSWKAFKELAGWERATEASRAWAAHSPRFQESGGWGWARAQTALSKAAAGGGGALMLMVVVILGGCALRDGVAGAQKWLADRRERLGADPEFVARAERRELDRLAREGKAEARSRGGPRL